MAQRPKELIEEIKDLMEVMQARLSTLKMAACLDATDGMHLQAEDAEAVRKMAEECALEIREFSQACVTRATEIKETVLPPEMKKQWTALAHEIVEVKRRAEVTVTTAKAATMKATEQMRKQRLEELKTSFRARFKDSIAAVPTAEDFVKTAESLIEPFLYGRPREETELDGLAEKVDEALAEAQGAVANARQEIKPMDEDVDDDSADPMLKKEFKAFVDSEEKTPRARLGQFDKRLCRISNIVTRYRKE